MTTAKKRTTTKKTAAASRAAHPAGSAAVQAGPPAKPGPARGDIVDVELDGETVAALVVDVEPGVVRVVTLGRPVGIDEAAVKP